MKVLHIFRNDRYFILLFLCGWQFSILMFLVLWIYVYVLVIIIQQLYLTLLNKKPQHKCLFVAILFFTVLEYPLLYSFTIVLYYFNQSYTNEILKQQQTDMLKRISKFTNYTLFFQTRYLVNTHIVGIFFSLLLI